MPLFPLRKAVVCAFVILAASTITAAQTPSPEWVWINGNPPINQYNTGQQGPLGVPGFSYSPYGREFAAQWLDSSGSLWVFGGDGFTKNHGGGPFNDLWMFNPPTDEWTWVGGSLTGGDAGHYGAKGVADQANQPPARTQQSYWTDRTGKFWVYGGTAGTGFGKTLDDLWVFDPDTKLWTWVGGSQTQNQGPVYGTIGSPDAANSPGGIEQAMTWVDPSGTGWLYGGWRNDDVLEELWKLDFSTGQWTCVRKGTLNAFATYVSPGADPGARYGSAASVGTDGQLWMYGGAGFGISSTYSDIWELNPSSAVWTFVGGSQTLAEPGSYGSKGSFDPSNVPHARVKSASWSDSEGNLWVLGGDGFANACPLDDFWEWSNSLQQWAWMGGSSTYNCKSSANWGVHRLPAATNYPGLRALALTWYDGARAWMFGGLDEHVSAAPYNDLWEFGTVTPAPEFSLPHGTYEGPQMVALSDANPDAVIYYTTDGTVPTVLSKVYSSPVLVTDTTLKATAMAPGMLQSIEVWSTYKQWVRQITPTPGSTLSGSSVTFTWSRGNADSAFRLRLGTAAGGSNLYDSGTTGTSAAVTHLPTNGTTIHATLSYKVSGVWHAEAFTYTAQ